MIRITFVVNDLAIAVHTFEHRPGWTSWRVFSGADIMVGAHFPDRLTAADRIEIRIEEITE